MTKYAQKICQIISSSRQHMTAEQIFDALRQAYPTVALATVYNNLNKLWRDRAHPQGLLGGDAGPL